MQHYRQELRIKQFRQPAVAKTQSQLSLFLVLIFVSGKN